MNLAIFDLDHTLLSGDSDYLWGCFLVDHGLVDPRRFAEANDRFYADYREGRLDIDAYLRFSLEPLTRFDLDVLHAWRRRFVDERIRPLMRAAGLEQVRWHRSRGHQVLIITATNAFVTRPIAELFEVDVLLATEPELVADRYTGGWLGLPTFREGKVRVFEDWCAQSGQPLQDVWFYSDSHNDLPLLERVTHPVAIDPDPQLLALAQSRGWPVRSFQA